MTPSTVAFVESNTSGTGPWFLAAAEQLGHRAVLLTEDASRYPFASEVDVEPVATSDVAAVVGACRGLAQRGGGLAGVLTSSDHYLAVVAEVAAALAMPGPPPDAVAGTRDKGEQRRRLVEAGVAVPAHVVARDPDEAAAAARIVGLPAVVKPVTGSGSIGVRMCVTAGETATHAAALLATARNERGGPVPRRVLVEELVVGPELSVEVFAGRAVGITAKHLGPPPAFVEVGHDHPADLSAPARGRVEETALAAVAGLDLTSGPAHVELRLAARGPVVIEVNARLAGGMIPRLVQMATGTDLVAATVRSACGLDASVGPFRARAASIRFLCTPGDGELVGLAGVETARSLPGVVDVTHRPAGTTVAQTGDFRERIAHVIGAGTDTAASAAAADAGLAALHAEVGVGARP